MKNNLATTIILLIIAITLLVFSVSRDKKEKVIVKETQQAIEQIQKTLSPYESKDKMKKVVIIENFKNSSVNGKESGSFAKKVIVKGIIKNGFLYVRASVNNKALSEYDDVYAKITRTIGVDYLDFGGHLIESQSLDIPIKNEDFTEMLFELSDVRYKKSINSSLQEVISGNWLDILNNEGKKSVLGFTSTTQQGVIYELALFYECLEKTQCSVVAQ